MANELIIDDELLEAAEADTETSVGDDFDPDAEYNQSMPPLPDGWHQATLTNLGAKDKEKGDDASREFVGPRPWGNIPKTYYTRVEASVIDPDGKQNNKKATGNITTHAEKTQDGSPRGSAAGMYYRAITSDPLPGPDQGKHIALVAKELRNNPIVWVKTRLEGSDRAMQDAYKERKKKGQLSPGEKDPTLRGQAAFVDDNPQSPTFGKLRGEKVLSDGTIVVARPVIMDVKHISFNPPTPKK